MANKSLSATVRNLLEWKILIHMVLCTVGHNQKKKHKCSGKKCREALTVEYIYCCFTIYVVKINSVISWNMTPLYSDIEAT